MPSGVRKRLCWFKEEDFDGNNIPPLKPKRLSSPVYCVELVMHFLSQTEAKGNVVPWDIGFLVAKLRWY